MQQSALRETQSLGQSVHTGGWVPASQGAEGKQSFLEPEWQMLSSAWNCLQGEKKSTGGRGRAEEANGVGLGVGEKEKTCIEGNHTGEWPLSLNTV